MKQLLNLLRSDTEIVLRPGRYLGEYIIRGVRYINNSNKVSAEYRINLDFLRGANFTEDKIWKDVCDEIWHGLSHEELRFYERLMNGGDMDAKFGIEMSGMRLRDILPEHGGMEMRTVSAPSVLPGIDKGVLCESKETGLE